MSQYWSRPSRPRGGVLQKKVSLSLVLRTGRPEEKCSKVFKIGLWQRWLYRGLGALPLPPSLGRDCHSVPANISHAADYRLSRTMVESSPPSPRVRTAAGPDMTLDIAANPGQRADYLPLSLTVVLYPEKSVFFSLEPGAHLLTSLFVSSVARVGLLVPSAGSLYRDHVSARLDAL